MLGLAPIFIHNYDYILYLWVNWGSRYWRLIHQDEPPSISLKSGEFWHMLWIEVWAAIFRANIDKKHLKTSDSWNMTYEWGYGSPKIWNYECMSDVWSVVLWIFRILTCRCSMMISTSGSRLWWTRCNARGDVKNVVTRHGKHTKKHGKSPCFMGKFTINWWIFHSLLC